MLAVIALIEVSNTHPVPMTIWRYSLVAVGAEAGGLVVLLAVDVGAVVECLVPPPNWPPPLLVLRQTGQILH